MTLAKRIDERNRKLLEFMATKDKAGRNAEAFSTPVNDRETETSAANVSFATTINEVTNSDNVTTDKPLSLPASDNRPATFVGEPTLQEKKHQFVPNDDDTVCVIGGNSLSSRGSRINKVTTSGIDRDGGVANKGTTSDNDGLQRQRDPRKFYEKRLVEAKKKKKTRRRRRSLV